MQARELIDGRYEPLAELGQGAMGSVLRAFDRDAQREVALKLLLAGGRPAARARFRREAELTARLRHPGIVRIHAAGEHAGRPYLVYELVPEGRTLEDLWDELTREAGLELLEQVAAAVGAAHELGIVHRDLKPSNVLVDAEGRARVADFGVAFDPRADRLTRTGALVGSPTYMAPELLGGERERVGPATDVWALSVMLCELLCGQPPFPASNLLELSSRIAKGEPEVPRSAVEGPLRALILAGLQPQPEDRPPDGRAFCAALRAARSAPFAARRRPGYAWAGVACVTALLLGGLLWLAAQPPRSQARAAAPSPSAGAVSPTPPPASPTLAPRTVGVRRFAIRAPQDLAWWGEELLVATQRDLRLYAPDRPEPIRTWLGTYDACRVLPSGAVLLLYREQELRLLESRDSEPRPLELARRRLECLSVSRDGQWLASYEGGEVVVRRWVDGALRPAWRLVPPHPDVRALLVTPTRVYCGAKHNLVAWELTRGAPVYRHNAGPISMALDEQGSVFACGFSNGAIELRRAEDARLVKILSVKHATTGPAAALDLAHLGSVRALAFVGGRLVSTCRNDDPLDPRREEDASTIALWDVASGARLGWEQAPREGSLGLVAGRGDLPWVALGRKQPVSVLALRSLSGLARARGESFPAPR